MKEMYSMRRLIIYAKSYWGHIVFTALASVGCSLTNVWVIDILKQLIDQAVVGALGGELMGLIVRVLLVIMIGMLANYCVVWLTGVFGAGILRDLRRDFINHIVKFSPDFIEKNNFGDVIERMSSDVEGIAGYMKTYFKDCLYVPIAVTVFTIYLILINPVLAIVCLGPLAVMVPLSIKLLKPVKIAQAEYVKQLGLTNNHIQEAFDGADVIKSYNLQKKMKNRYTKALKKTFDISNHNDLWQYNIEPLSCLIREAPRAIALCFGGYLALKGEVTLGMLVAFISGIGKVNEPLVDAYQLVVRTQMALISVKRVFEILEMPIEDEDSANCDVDMECKKVFEFRDVSFSYSGYEETNKVILKDLNLTVGKGKRIALVGQSGCGKSTIIKLMCRQYEVMQGEILFYGKNLLEVCPVFVRSHIALISQDIVLFPMSVLDNIRIGRPEASHEEIMDAARKAGCDMFVSELPQGYDTVLEEKGNNLSGGQRQRLCIARAILKDAPILLLDEPTSALDIETEEYVSKMLSEISRDKTVVTVAHRLSTIADYDEIIEVQGGTVL
ncbi:MAG: ABC transporter ATP-binding protein [Lachnospiraceae bacterium]|nr:ABC transporter ATP-binding protein [Lachnospiraceae bacterium]